MKSVTEIEVSVTYSIKKSANETSNFPEYKCMKNCWSQKPEVKKLHGDKLHYLAMS